MKITNSKDLILLLLYAKGYRSKQCEPIAGKTRLMKMIFLFDKELKKKFNLAKTISDDAFPDFTAYDYGPYSEQVYIDLEFLVDLNLVKVKKVKSEEDDMSAELLEYEYWQAGSGDIDTSDIDERMEVFSLTPNGRGFVEEELSGLTDEQWEALDKFKSRCTGIPLKALLRYVYAKYRKLTTNSKIRDEILS
ncbi:MAG: hypothetical protein MRK02_00160 [Candidatus Scalindua sp.]|nr:hypothetical protein [Candidatus Scalindua sp.]